MTELPRFQYTPAVNAARNLGPDPLLVFSSLYSFGTPPDGNSPYAGLLDVGGTFYGTTDQGGKYCTATGGCGTVFSITTKGKETVLHSFGNGTDGAYPWGGLIDVNGTLYGTTAYGGAHGCSPSYACGTVFSITTSGTENVVHSFGSGSDGKRPLGDLLNVGGVLYGTTYTGGTHQCSSSYACGTIFSITTKNKEKVVYNFAGGTSDGWGPYGALINVSGTLYGTTFGGGAHGGGTVFSVTTKGSEKVLHGFGSGTDGLQPVTGLVDAGGTLYGTTAFGGAYGYGAAFSVTTKGAEKVMHSFGNGSDGANPSAPLTSVHGTLYGAAVAGGAQGYGAIFSVTTKDKEKLIYSFGGSDGWYPRAGLTNVGGTLYSTTAYGGAYTCFSFTCGTVFSITTGGTENVLRRSGTAFSQRP